MKLSRVFFLLIASAASSQSAWSDPYSKPVLREVWTCKSKSDEFIYVSSLDASIDHVKKTSSGTLTDRTMSQEPVKLSKDTSTSHLSGGIYGWDNRSYKVQLVRSLEEDFDEYSLKTKTAGVAVVVYGGSIDCVGTVGGAEVLSCDIELIRSAN